MTNMQTGTVPKAGTLSLKNLLAHMGHHPVHADGHRLYYQDVLSESHGRPNFEVDLRLGVWYDFSDKRGGDIFDLGRVCWKGLPEQEIVDKVRSLGLSEPEAGRGKPSRRRRKRRAVKLPHLVFGHTVPIGTDPELTDWMRWTGSYEIAGRPMAEVHYYFIDESQRRKDFLAAGWPNENGGWEVRCRHYSGCVGPKGMTYLPGRSDTLTVFGRLVDYLVWRHRNGPSTANILLVNHAGFLQAACKRARKFPRAAISLDRGLTTEPLTDRVVALLLETGLPELTEGPCRGL